MTDFRRWLAGWFGQVADWLYPHYSVRVRNGEFVE